MKTFAAALFAAVAQSAELMTETDYKFMAFISEHGKMYATVEEFMARKDIFRATDAAINEINADPNQTHVAGHNKFSDWTEHEFSNILGLKGAEEREVIPDVVEANYPSAWDWRAQGKVTAVKDQGSCGSCWAFSSIEAIESAWMIAGNSEVIMSEQELVDCTRYPVTNNNGCNGGWYFWSYDWLKNNKTMKEADYRYTARDGTCQYNASKGVTTVSSYGQVNGTSANLNAIARQPVNVAVAAGNYTFQSYRSGIISANSGCPTAVDHAIVAVGYGEENGVQYYIVRNSWGTSWGESGYVRIETSGGKGTCGINQYVYYPTL